MISTSPLTFPATGLGASYLIIVTLGYCFLDDYKETVKSRTMHALAAYNVALFLGHFVMAAYLVGVRGGGPLLPGQTNNQSGEMWIAIHAYSRFVHFVDTIIIFLRQDKARLTWAHIFHNTCICALWALVLDNTSVLADAGIRLQAACHSVKYTLVHLYFAFTTYGACAYPCSYVVTVMIIAIHSSLVILDGVLWYQAYNDETESSQPTLVVATVFGVYEFGMVLFTMPLMWKKRINKCCLSRRQGMSARTVGEAV